MRTTADLGRIENSIKSGIMSNEIMANCQECGGQAVKNIKAHTLCFFCGNIEEVKPNKQIDTERIRNDLINELMQLNIEHVIGNYDIDTDVENKLYEIIKKIKAFAKEEDDD